MNQRLTVHVSTGLAFGPIGIIWPFLPIHLRSLGASYLLIALVSLIPAIETIGLSPAWGGFLDKTGRGNKILLLSILAQGVGFSVFPFLQSPEEFVLVVSLMGLFSSSFIPVYGAMATLSTLYYCPCLRLCLQQLLHRLPRRRSQRVEADSWASGHRNNGGRRLCLPPRRASQRQGWAETGLRARCGRIRRILHDNLLRHECRGCNCSLDSANLSANTVSRGRANVRLYISGGSW